MGQIGKDNAGKSIESLTRAEIERGMNLLENWAANHPDNDTLESILISASMAKE